MASDYQTGAVRTLSFHLYGYTPEEEAQVFEEMVPPRRQWRARP